MTASARHGQQCSADLGEIARSFAILGERGAVIEVRALGVPRVKVVAGYFDDPERAAASAARVSERATGVYATLNRINPALLARAANRLVDGLSPLTSDADITRRTRLLIDFDPRRPTGISSTEAEHDAALARALLARDTLLHEGFPPMLLGDSGNGAHLVCGLDLPNTAETRALVEHVLHALDLRFGDDVVAVDTSTFNAARISKLYGTLAAKGDATADRPHRLAGILEAPDTLCPVPEHLLERLAVLHDDMGSSPGASGANDSRSQDRFTSAFDLDAWLAAHGLVVVRTGLWKGGRKLILEVCPWDPSHTNGAAYIIEFPNGALAAGCLHDGCRQKRWQDLRALFETDYRERQHHAAGGSRAGSSGSRLPKERPWPEPPDPIVYRGLAGRLVEVIMPHTEADPMAVLVNVLLAFGSAVGDGAHALVGATRHPAREFAVLVGRSSKARKGESWNPPRLVFEYAAPDWAGRRVAGGLSTGEGLIHEVRDPVEKLEPIKDKGKITGYQTVIVDEGEPDKRLLVVEPEFARPLRVMSRQGNTLEAVLRDAWDRGNLRVMTRTSPLRATGAHISLIGHVTVDELRRELSDISIANGFANRLLWICVRRSKDLPDPVPFAGDSVTAVAAGVATALQTAQSITQVSRDPDANTIWHAVYPALAGERDGLAGALLARAEAHVLRLALVYALLDGSAIITADHLLAALALWEYVEASVEYVFGDATGDPIADTILAALRQNGELTRTQISDLFGRNSTSVRIAQALQLLLRLGKARAEKRNTGGRPREVWMIV